MLRVRNKNYLSKKWSLIVMYDLRSFRQMNEKKIDRFAIPWAVALLKRKQTSFEGRSEILINQIQLKSVVPSWLASMTLNNVLNWIESSEISFFKKKRPCENKLARNNSILSRLVFCISFDKCIFVQFTRWIFTYEEIPLKNTIFELYPFDFYQSEE